MFHFKSSTLDDLKAGLVVSFVALPLCLGIALASGAPALSGLIAGIIGGIIIGFLSPSHLSVSGPAAGLTVVILNAIIELGSFQAFLPALIFAGFLQFAMGSFKLGKISNYIHHSVIDGMLCAIGLIIILKQLPHMFGLLNIKYSKIFKIQFNDDIHLGAFLIGLISLVIVILYQTTTLKKYKLFKHLPLSMLLIIIASLLAALFSLSPSLKLYENLFVDLGGITGGTEVFSSLIFPDFSQALSLTVLKYGLIIAFVASIETLLCIKAADQIDPLQRVTSTNKELMAQGFGNTISGFLGGLPITSVIVRTSVNTQAGAKTKLSAIFHGFILLIGLLVFPKIITHIPLAVLACILVHAGYNLAHPKQLSQNIKSGYQIAIPFFLTLIIVVAKDILLGVLLGQCASIVLNSKLNIFNRQA